MSSNVSCSSRSKLEVYWQYNIHGEDMEFIFQLLKFGVVKILEENLRRVLPSLYEQRNNDPDVMEYEKEIYTEEVFQRDFKEIKDYYYKNPLRYDI